MKVKLVFVTDHEVYLSGQLADIQRLPALDSYFELNDIKGTVSDITFISDEHYYQITIKKAEKARS